MSHHSEDNFVVAGSDSFWEPGNYKRTTKRIEDGNKLCTELMNLVTERAEIEKNYAKSLKAWAAKWNSIIEKGPEYGTMEAAWKAVLVESDRRCDLHTKVKEDLHLKVNTQLKLWQKDNYHKSMMQLREKKEMDEQFKKAQKPWAKLLQRVNKTKADYHNACKNEKTAVNQERNASGDSSLSQDQLRKLNDRVEKTKEQVSKCRDSYEMALSDLDSYHSKYIEDMKDVFERCQRMEAQRLQCFKDVLFTIQNCLNISEDPVLPQIYEEFYHTVNNADHEKDLRWWSNTHGANMAMNWPQFEDYTEEFREIAGKSKKIVSGTGIDDGNITLINQRHVGDDLPEMNSGGGARTNGSKPRSIADEVQRQGSNNIRNSTSENPRQANPVKSNVEDTRIYKPELRCPSSQGKNPFEVESSDDDEDAFHDADESPPVTKSDDDHLPTSDLKLISHPNGGTSSTAAAATVTTPFEDEEWEEEDGHADPLEDTGEPGVKVRALYDYDAAEDDELNLAAGDLFEKLEDEDEQGWCKGRKDGRVGLYPANYVELC